MVLVVLLVRPIAQSSLACTRSYKAHGEITWIHSGMLIYLSDVAPAFMLFCLG